MSQEMTHSSEKQFSTSDQRIWDLAHLTTSEVLKYLGIAATGLTQEAIASLRKEWGENLLVQQKNKNLIGIIFGYLKNPLLLQLLIIAIVSLILGEPESAIVVSFMVVASVGITYYQESRSGKAVEKLCEMVETSCQVLRDGERQEIPMSELLPGDIVYLQAGSLIAADMRLITTKDFFVGQSSLTGESTPVEKISQPHNLDLPLLSDQLLQSDHTILTEEKPPIIELPNIIFQGSNVLSGTAQAIVINTGSHTHLGTITERLSQGNVETSFDRGIAGFTWLMIRFMVVMVSIVFLIIGFKDHNWGNALLFGLSVAVGLTPEMLPMVVAATLSKGALVMSRKKVIVKRLNAIQNFGAIDILCTDKTGTLTQDRVFLEKHVDVTNRESDDVLRYAYMNSYYQTGLNNFLDDSVLSHTELDVDRNCKKVDEIPFDFQRKRMSVVVDYEGDHVLVCKGAVEDIYNVCSHYQVDDEVYMMIDLIKNDLLEEYQSLSRDGYRVLGIAYREFSREKTIFSTEDENNLILLGYIAFLDPPKESAAKAIASLKEYGVATKILTGDNALVTKTICKDVGLDATEVITGNQLTHLSQEELGILAEKQNVFARLSPTQKEEIILALQKRGHVVGYMGDGINDALSMRVADVGISVDTAVDIAKESADVILLEKSLMVLEDGILEGRRIFGNIIKYIRMGASSNFGNMFSVLGGSWILPFLPMSPIQVLVNNLLYDTSQLAIPTDHVDDAYLHAPRKWNIANIGRYMICIGPLSSIFDYATFFLMLYFFRCHLFGGSTTSTEMNSYYEKLFHSGWFVESILTQTLIVHIIRTTKIPFFQSIASPFLLISTGIIMILGATLPYTSLGHYLGLIPLPLIYWPWIFLFLICYATITHKVNLWCIKRFGLD